MTFDSAITDVDFLYLIDPTDSDWGKWEVEVMFESGYTARGTLMGDGQGNWDADTFEQDDLV